MIHGLTGSRVERLIDEGFESIHVGDGRVGIQKEQVIVRNLPPEIAELVF